MAASESDLRVDRLTPGDADDLSSFEVRNRAFFEHWVNARPPAYYATAGVARAIEAAVDDAAADRAYQFIARENGRLVARVNLTGVRRAHFESASLGFRVDEECVGRGVARRAVAHVLQVALSDLRLVRIEATARPENIGSRRVLEAVGFTAFGRSTRSMCLGDRWFDQLHFEKRLTDVE